jgi:hypothetical protein
MTQDPTDQIHALTAAEITRQIEGYNDRGREIVEERRVLYLNAIKSGGGGTTPVHPDERAAREYAKCLLNGIAPSWLTVPPEASRDQILLREQRAIEIVLKILSDQRLAMRASEAVRWAETNADRWQALCRDVVLAAVRLNALERCARELLEQCVDTYAVRLPMGNIIGSRPVSDFSISDLIEAALAEGVATSAEIKKAEKAGT